MPFTLVVHAVQSDHATLADVTRYWMYLTRLMSEVKASLTEPSFKAHYLAAFNWREQDMHEHMFNPYQDGWRQMRDELVDSSAILDFNPAFNLDFQGNVVQEQMPNLDFGSSNEQSGVNDVLQDL